jgi:glycosyltransferase involved in cell wall biosynthesis
MPPRVVCLLPARNAAADLPDFFASAARVCDAVVALDDGSTDETRDILAAHPLVACLLTNPVRADYRNWDDAANRNRLLAAAADLEPDWILSIDADERFDPSDAAALRAFLATDALPGCAYGFRHASMRGDPDHYVPRFQCVYRLFAFEPGQRFPSRRLHFVPVPTSIPRSRWFRTTIRLQHVGSLTAERRLARFEKYIEADPDRAFHQDYGHLLYDPPPGELRRWEPRPPDLPVLFAATDLEETDDPAMDGPATDQDAPALSAIVIARDNEATIARTVASVVGQDCPEPFEVIVVVSGTDRTAAIVRERFPTVRLIELSRPALPGEARNAGLRVARGTFVTFPGSHVELPPGSLVGRIRAHREGYAMVTPVTENGTRTRAGWASYFIDQHLGMPGHGRAVLDCAPYHCSYARLPLVAVGGFPEGVRTAEDTAVNEELFRRGYVALRDPATRIVHHSPCRTPWRLIRHHFRRGRGQGWLLLRDYRTRGRLLNRRVLATRLVGFLPRRLGRIARSVPAADPALGPHYRRARPLIVAGIAATWFGLWVEVLRPTPGKGTILWGRPVRTLALIDPGDGPPVILLLRLDLAAKAARAVAVPPDLPTTRPDGTRSRLVEALGCPLDAASPDAVRDVLGRAVDLDAEDVVVVTPGTLRSPSVGAVALDLSARDIRCSTLDDRGRRTLVRVLRRVGPLPVAAATGDGSGADGETAAPAAIARSVRVALGYDPDRSAPVGPGPGPTWWP